MKILSPIQISEADAFTIKNEPISSINLMERAARKCVDWIVENVDMNKSIDVFCGIGNNGGDGLAISRLLIEKGCDLRVFIVEFSKNNSNDFQVNLERLKAISKVDIVDSRSSIPSKINDLVIDAVFGVGLSRPAIGFTKELIDNINKSLSQVISVDMPSGLFSQSSLSEKDSVIRSDVTLTFQTTKLSLLLPKYSIYSGEVIILDIGLDKEFLQSVDSFYYLLDKYFVKSLLKKREKYSHKGSYGHSLLVGGSSGKIGAILLATKAAVKSGSGLVTSLIPKCAYQILQISVPEAMVLIEGDNYLDSLHYSIKPTAIGIGPGLGTIIGTHNLLRRFLEGNKTPMVLDADALNHLSQHRELLDMLQEGTVLTPHPKEFERLVGKWKNDFEKMKLASEFSMNYQVIVVLKGAHTAIFVPDGRVFFNSTGNPGLATGGSGDVLTGIITSLMAQGYSNLNASIIGVYLHGRTAELSIGLGEESEESFSASNIIDNLGRAFLELKDD
ncbi:MAG: NAD(P)H-hydrate dehydratase [Flavobacteriales bacterium]|nr:NAD(P)H-hydrate dehydratase [Flavobacteriales bacterium]